MTSDQCQCVNPNHEGGRCTNTAEMHFCGPCQSEGAIRMEAMNDGINWQALRDALVKELRGNERPQHDARKHESEDPDEGREIDQQLLRKVGEVSEPNEQLTAERATKLVHFWTESWSAEEIRAFLRAFAEQQATIEKLQRYLHADSDGSHRDWVADCQAYEKDIAERDRTIEQTRKAYDDVTDAYLSLSKKKDALEEAYAEQRAALAVAESAYKSLQSLEREVHQILFDALKGPATGIPPVQINSLDMTRHALQRLAAAEEKLEACESRRERLESQLLSMPPDSGDVGQVRYTTDDIDIDEQAHELVIHNGRNGDWYVAVVPQGVTPLHGVRITTSGMRVLGLAGAVADAYRAIAAAGDRAVLPRSMNGCAE